MKTLFILRHGKSAPEDTNLKDIERPLLKLGVERTLKIADFLNKRKFQIQAIVSSNAVRAYSTAKIIATETNYPVSKIAQKPNLYNSDVDNYFNTIFECDDKLHSLMIVAHNPAITNFSNLFLENKIAELPTSGLVIIRFNCEKWVDINTADSELIQLISPKEI